MAKQGQELQVPIIDLSPSYVSSVGRQQVADEIRQACLSSGFFYITSHSIPAPACDGVLQQAEHLLKHSPLSEKRCIHIDNSPHGYGWEPSESTSIAGDIETKEAFNRCYSDDLDPTGGDGQYVQLDGTRTKGLNQWPSEDVVPGFYDEVKTYYGQALLLARHLCRLFALSLALPENYFDSKTTHPSANSRMIFYPAGSPTLEDVAPGLEIMSPSGDWMQAPPVPGGLVVNIGDMMMRWTNGLYESTMHRVINRTGEERYSVPLFFGINNDEFVETLPTCVTVENPALYPPIRAGEYILQRLNATRKAPAPLRSQVLQT